MPTLNDVLKDNKKTAAITAIDTLISREANKAFYNRSRGRSFKTSFAMYYLVINRLLKKNISTLDPLLATRIADKLATLCKSKFVPIIATTVNNLAPSLDGRTLVLTDGKGLVTLDNKYLIIL